MVRHTDPAAIHSAMRGAEVGRIFRAPEPCRAHDAEHPPASRTRVGASVEGDGGRAEIRRRGRRRRGPAAGDKRERSGNSGAARHSSSESRRVAPQISTNLARTMGSSASPSSSGIAA